MKLILNIVSLRKSVVLIAFFSFASILYVPIPTKEFGNNIND